jgi:methionyl aminopeptidase
MRPKSDAEIEIMRQGGRQLASILDELAKQVAPGVSGKDISAMASKMAKEAGMQTVLLGYLGFPEVMCISVNDAVVHGIPSKKVFKEGDLVKLDLTLGYRGLVVDSAVTVFVGDKQPEPEVKKLIDTTKQSLSAGIAAIHGEGTATGDIGSAIQEVLEGNGFGVVRDLVGHGVGYGVHEGLEVPNYGRAGTGRKLIAGTTIAIEPMSTMGDWRVNVLPDDWTVVSRDGSLTAHFEHTVLVTEDAAEILTQS